MSTNPEATIIRISLRIFYIWPIIYHLINSNFFGSFRIVGIFVTKRWISSWISVLRPQSMKCKVIQPIWFWFFTARIWFCTTKICSPTVCEDIAEARTSSPCIITYFLDIIDERNWMICEGNKCTKAYSSKDLWTYLHLQQDH